MTNRLSDLEDILFTQLRRVAEASGQGEQLDAEIKRTEAVVSIADRISHTADTRLKAAKLFAEHGQAVLPMLPQIGGPAGKPEGQG